MKKYLLLFLSLILTTCLLSVSALAHHAWENYHWARMDTSFNLILVNSTTSDWDPYVKQAVFEWSDPNNWVGTPYVMFAEDTSGATSKRIRRQCNANNGQLRICNLAYGQNGWLGIAGISLDADDHITRGYTKLNDSYFSLSYYNSDDWKQSVTCQELGHNIGLGHQDEDFNHASSTSCMEYQSPPFPTPDAHDYEELASIYSHLDNYNSFKNSDSGSGSTEGGTCNAPQGKGCNKSEKPGNNADIGWGMSLGRRGQGEVFLRIDHDGIRHLTHVTWAIGH